MKRICMVLGLSLLACSGAGDVEGKLAGLCDLQGEIAPISATADLITFDGPVRAPKLQLTVAMTVEETTIDGRFASSPAQLEQLLGDGLASARAISDATGEPFSASANVVIDSGVPQEDVWQVFRALDGAGMKTVDIVGWSEEKQPAIAFADPSFGAEVRAELAAAAPEMQAMLLAGRMEAEVALCPPAQRTFEAVAYASPESRCFLMVAGLKEALPSCPMVVNADRVITLTQIMTSASSAFKPMVFTVNLDGSKPLPETPPGAAWADVAGTVYDHQASFGVKAR
jgi:hypothetical protein